MTHAEFIRKMVSEFLRDQSASVLVGASARAERELFSDLGFENVHFTGMDLRDEVSKNAPSSFENLESLSFADDSFDYAFVKDAVHHTALPHKVLTELFRVSRKGFLVFEGRDSALTRLASTAGLTENYEVAGNHKGHGVNGSDIPNFIFRWTEREVYKTLRAFAPHLNHRVSFRYHTNYPNGHGFGRLGRVVIRALYPCFRLFTALFPKQQNLMAFFVAKPKIPEDLKPWLIVDQGSGELIVNKPWIKSHYSKRLSK